MPWYGILITVFGSIWAITSILNTVNGYVALRMTKKNLEKSFEAMQDSYR